MKSFLTEKETEEVKNYFLRKNYKIMDTKIHDAGLTKILHLSKDNILFTFPIQEIFCDENRNFIGIILCMIHESNLLMYFQDKDQVEKVKIFA